MNKKARIEWFGICLALFFATLIIIGTVNEIMDYNDKRDLCESKGLEMSNNQKYCIDGDKAYQIMYVGNEWKIVKEVVTLGLD